MQSFDLPLFLIILATLSALYLLLGYRAATPGKSHEDFLLSGRTLGPFALTMTIVATQLGGGTLLGSAEEAYRSGWSVLFYPMGSCLGLLFLASGFGARMRKMGLTTVSELFESVYHSKFLRKFSSILSIVSLFIILLAQGIAARKFLHSLGLYNPFFFVGCWAVLITYTMSGGLQAVVNTDIVQALFIMGAFAAAMWLGTGLDQLHIDSSQLLSTQLFTGDAPWSSWLLMPFCFMLIEQDIGQRLFAAKNRRSIRLACLSACLIMMLTTALPIALGNLARQIGCAAPDDSSILLTVISHVSSPAFSSIFACAILMAILSTADSLLCSITSNLAFDFPLSKSAPTYLQTHAPKFITLIVGLAGVIFSYLFNQVIDVLIFSYELSVAILFVPVVFGFLWPGARKQAAIASICSSSFVYGLSLFVGSDTICGWGFAPLGPYFAGWMSWCSSYGVWLAMLAGLIAFTSLQLDSTKYSYKAK